MKRSSEPHNGRIRNMRRTAIAIAAAITVIVSLSAKKSHDMAVNRNLSIFNSIVKELELNYVDSIRTDEAFNSAITALLNEVDPYTEYYTADDREGLQSMTTGEYGGIGSYIMERDGYTYISGPYENSPAALAGLIAGDKIIRIDTTDLKGKKSSEVSAMLKGQPGTEVKIRVVRPYVADSILDFTVERKKLLLPSVPYYGVTHGNTGYIRLTSFMEKSAQEVRTALESFKNDPQVKNIVLDLRGNGGGLLESAVDIVNLFVPKGTEVLRTRGRDKASEKIYKTTKNPLMPDIPLAVLIDGASASASEITAGAIQDLDRGILLGSRSYGKGLVQSTRPLPYDGLLKVTVSKYYIPSGRLIQAVDYSHRNPDGSVARMPDSLATEYKTLHGRTVRDGGGLTPDVTIDWGTPNRLVFNLVRDNWIFDFATRYAAENKEIPSPFEFRITDEIYDAFKKSVDPERLKYDKVCEDLVAQLRKTAETEGYLDETTAAQIDTLSKSLTHNLDKDFNTHRGEIEEYLSTEIIGRYYNTKGEIIQALKTDKAVDKAAEILNNPEEYSRMLKASSKADSKKQ